jgi:hypothetical protein
VGGWCADRSNNRKRSCVSPRIPNAQREPLVVPCSERAMASCQQPPLGWDHLLNHYSSLIFHSVYPAACTIGATSLSRTLVPPYTHPHAAVTLPCVIGISTAHARRAFGCVMTSLHNSLHGSLHTAGHSSLRSAHGGSAACNAFLQLSASSLARGGGWLAGWWARCGLRGGVPCRGALAALA